MPRRHRHPASAREIGAYLCGGRLQRAYLAIGEEFYDREVVARQLAYEDAELLASMKEHTFWYYFEQGWLAALATPATP